MPSKIYVSSAHFTLSQVKGSMCRCGWIVRLTLRDESTLVNESGGVEGTSGDVDITGGDVEAAVLREDLLGLLLDRLRDSHRGGLSGWATRSARTKDFYQRWDTKGPLQRQEKLTTSSHRSDDVRDAERDGGSHGGSRDKGNDDTGDLHVCCFGFLFFSWEVFLVKRK